MWRMYDEAHVTTIAVHPDVRGQRLGEELLVHLLDEAIERSASWITLEVRESNDVAQKLYRETEASRELRLKLAEERKAMPPVETTREGKPSKRDRREIARLRGGERDSLC